MRSLNTDPVDAVPGHLVFTTIYWNLIYGEEYCNNAFDIPPLNYGSGNGICL